jgi:benzoate-CoA ligase
MLRLGVQAEQRVLLVLPDGIEFAAAYFGAIKIGAVAIPTNTALRAADYAWIVEPRMVQQVEGLESQAGLHGLAP